MLTNLLLADADLQRRYCILQLRTKTEARSSSYDKKKHLRFTRVPFLAEGSPFILEATLQHHVNQRPSKLEVPVRVRREEKVM